MGSVSVAPARITFRNGERFAEPQGFSLHTLGRGVYESFLARREKGGFSVLALTAHFARMSRGNEKLGSPHFNPPVLRERLRRHLADAELSGSAIKVRLIVTPGDSFIMLEDAVAPSPEAVPIALFSFAGERPHPETKFCPSAVSVSGNDAALSSGFDEALLIGPGEVVREGAWSNFFWIDAGNVLHTPASAMLPGVTRGELLELARGKFEISLDDASLAEVLSRANEAFITSAFRGVVPVGRIDDALIGGGKPGERTMELRRAYLTSPRYEMV